MRFTAMGSRLRRNGLFGGRPRECRRTLLAACVLVLCATQYAAAQEGLYAGVAAGWDRASTDYTKGVGLDVPPASYETATNDAQGGFGTVRASFGYRTFVVGRAYVSGEFEAAFHGGSGAAGYLREGTGVGDRDVWPGPWNVEKNLGLGANARLTRRVCAGRTAGRGRIRLLGHRPALDTGSRAARFRHRRRIQARRARSHAAAVGRRCGRGVGESGEPGRA